MRASTGRRARPFAAGVLVLGAVVALTLTGDGTRSSPSVEAAERGVPDAGATTGLDERWAPTSTAVATGAELVSPVAGSAGPASEGTPADARRRGQQVGERPGSWQRDPLSRSAIEAGFVPGTARDDDPASVLTPPRRGASFPRPAAVTDEGFHVVAGTSSAGEGDTVTFTIELDPGLGADPAAVRDVIEDALYDARSWASTVRLERVEDPEAARIRVVLAHPDVVDELCGAAGLDTGGRYSCWTGAIAALNAWRWEVGADGFRELDTYRRYLVNHEVGHGLGHGHVGCPGPGALAPVMMQQSISTGDCVANGWPFPER